MARDHCYSCLSKNTYNNVETILIITFSHQAKNETVLLLKRILASEFLKKAGEDMQYEDSHMSTCSSITLLNGWCVFQGKKLEGFIPIYNILFG